ncbi:MAG: hypothetical protein JKY56_07940 [Kofleriaceae bacterium]|nr:hypothetical protein [Kofleriaceae bacterium]
MDEKQLTTLFLAQKIEPSEFRHMDHLRVAYEMLHANDFIDAIAQYAKGIRSMASRAGAPAKFNVTITIAFMSLVAERIHIAPQKCFSEFISENGDLLQKDVLDQWYGQDRLQSDVARQIFLLPNVDG